MKYNAKIFNANKKFIKKIGGNFKLQKIIQQNKSIVKIISTVEKLNQIREKFQKLNPKSKYHFTKSIKFQKLIWTKKSIDTASKN